MCQELENLVEEFARYRGKKKRTKYPQNLWDRAIELSKQHSIKKVADALGICRDSLNRHFNSRKMENNTPQFVPIRISEPPLPIQVHIGGAIPVTIDFCRSIEELAKLVLVIQRGALC